MTSVEKYINDNYGGSASLGYFSKHVRYDDCPGEPKPLHWYTHCPECGRPMYQFYCPIYGDSFAFCNHTYVDKQNHLSGCDEKSGLDVKNLIPGTNIVMCYNCKGKGRR
jgi:hypothetical protein